MKPLMVTLSVTWWWPVLSKLKLMMWLCWLTHGHGSCRWIFNRTPTMLVKALSEIAYGPIHRDSPTKTLGTLSLSKAPNKDDVVKKALKQGVQWIRVSQLGSEMNNLNNYKWSLTSKWWVCLLGKDVLYLTRLMEMILIGYDLSYSERKRRS